MKRFIKEFADYELDNIKDCHPLYVGYMTDKINKVLEMHERGLISVHETIQCIGNYESRVFYTIDEYNHCIRNEQNGEILWRSPTASNV